MYTDLLSPLISLIMTRLPSILLAVLALFVGWVVARMIGSLVSRLVGRLTQTSRVRELVGIKEEYRIDQVIGKVTYYLLMIFVLVLFFDILGVTAVMQPFLQMTTELTLAVPSLVKAVLILLAAWVLATILRGLTVRLLSVRGVGNALERMGVVEGESAYGKTITSAGDLVYYLVLIMFLPSVLGALNMVGLQEPVEAMVTRALTFLPNLVAAAVTALIGYVVAKVVRGVVTHFLASAGVDQLPEKVGMGQVFAATPLSGTLGKIAFVLVLIPVIISALESLGVEAISAPAIAMLTVILSMVPNLLIGLVLVAVGIALARWIGGLTTALLEKLNLTGFLVKWGLLKQGETEPPVPVTIGRVVGGLILLLMLIEVFDVVRLTALSEILRQILAYLPNLAVALLMLAAGLAVAQFADRSVRALLAETQYPGWLGGLARYAILILVSMMALEQLGVARSIVVNGFTILLGSAGLAAALAVGLGSREAVERYLARWTRE